MFGESEGTGQLGIALAAVSAIGGLLILSGLPPDAARLTQLRHDVQRGGSADHGAAAKSHRQIPAEVTPTHEPGSDEQAHEDEFGGSGA